MRRSAADLRAFLRRRAGEMRRWPTAAERRLWPHLEPLGFEIQVVFAPPGTNGYILDMYHAGARLCVEVDGGVHRLRKGRDRRRDARLRFYGITTVRVSNREALADLAGAVARIRSELAACLTCRT